MNKERRKRLDDVIDKLEELQQEVAAIGEEEREAYDNLPDNLNDTDMANQMSENADDLDSLDGDFESLLDSIRDIRDRQSCGRLKLAVNTFRFIPKSLVVEHEGFCIDKVFGDGRITQPKHFADFSSYSTSAYSLIEQRDGAIHEED